MYLNFIALCCSSTSFDTKTPSLVLLVHFCILSQEKSFLCCSMQSCILVLLCCYFLLFCTSHSSALITEAPNAISFLLFLSWCWYVSVGTLFFLLIAVLFVVLVSSRKLQNPDLLTSWVSSWCSSLICNEWELLVFWEVLMNVVNGMDVFGYPVLEK